ncbi:hypothetical protein NDU88_006698 [Pleurodeles waltl]|uniref:Uncharacterized protein n=1 Tax=Pleurodeles waltl TaxID=8319 RepID=A0AAV7NTV0_PLEWA|nr:hypothetical protein NDU88_006698 [Pleurodeles waltl]
MDVPRRDEACRGIHTQKDHKQALLAARVVVEVFGCCCSSGGTRMSPLGGGDIGSAQQVREPSQKQAAPAEVPEQALGRRVNWSPPEVTKGSPTTPEDNSEGCALQEGVSGTQAWLCTKEILEECTGAGAAANHAEEDSVDPREISSELLVQRGGRLPPEHAPPGNIEKAGRMKGYKVASSRLATLLRFCRRPEQSAVDPLAEGEEGDAEER